MDEKPKGSILMVEDERFFFLPLRDMLEARGYVISWASNATEAYQQLIEQGPTLDAVLLDLMLPLSALAADSLVEDPTNGRRGGLAAVKKARQETGLEVPVVVLTYVTDSEIRKEAEEIAIKVLSKQATFTDIYSQLERAVAISRARREGRSAT